MPPKKKTDRPIAEIRRDLTAVDRKIVALISDRTELTKRLYEKADYAEGANENAGWVPGPEELKPDEAGVTQLLIEIAAYCRSKNTTRKIAYLGPKFSYSYLAAKKKFGESNHLIPLGTIAAIFDSVINGESKFGIVPLENSTDGRIADSLTMFSKTEVAIFGEVHLPVNHCLVGQGQLADVREIRSKAQALSQCRQWIAKSFPIEVETVPTKSSTEAAEYVARKGKQSSAAIASREAAVALGLNIISEGIEDQKGNLTRFAIILDPKSNSESLPKKTGHDKTSLMFEVPHQPGALADVMNVFKRAKLNLTWIESFPKPDVFSEYNFFVELQGHQDEVRLRNAFKQLKKKTSSLSVLGSYPELAGND